MAAVDLISNFSVAAFNGVPDYHDVRVFGEDDKDLPSLKPTIEKFGALFAKHGKAGKARLSLTHRHFALKDGEMKVAWQDDDKSTLIIKADAASKYEGKKLLPYLFRVVKQANGKANLVPLEYVLHSKTERIADLESQIAAICDETFLREFADLLVEEKVDDLYGIMLPARDYLVPDYSNRRSTIEMSGKGDRTLIVMPYQRPNDEGGKGTCEKTTANAEITTVAWNFDEEGVPEEGPQCCHCTHCHHCFWSNHHAKDDSANVEDPDNKTVTKVAWEFDADGSLQDGAASCWHCTHCEHGGWRCD